MYSFIEKCINGDALSIEIDDYIHQWHTSNSNLEIYEFLGMTETEYALFVEDESYLGVIINAHIDKIGIDEVVKRLAMAARSDSHAKSLRLERWLKDEGLWE